ncbi:MAG TPA: sugar ABC transporter substrate-binding protein, partial [Ktedonobacteraceae bacterium]
MQFALWSGRPMITGLSRWTNSRKKWLRPINWFALSMSIFMVLTGFAACGSASSSGGKVNLTYALWDPTEQVGYQQSINLFMKQHPNIHVTIEETPWAQYWQKLDTEFAAGNAPDVFWDQVAYFPQFAQEGVLMDLTPQIQQDKLDTSIYYPSLLKQFYYQNKYYGLPKDWDTVALFYNKDIFQKMGLPAPTDLTWNPTDGGTLLKLAQQLTVDKNGLHPTQAGFNANAVKQYGFLSYNSNQELYWNFIAENGGQFINKPFGQFDFNQPKSVEALQFLVNLITKWHVSPPASETNNISNIHVQLFGQSKVAMILAGSWNTSNVIQQANFPFGIEPLPSGPQGRITVMNGLSDAIYAKTQHPQEAWELEKWLASSQSQQIVTSGGYVWSGIQSIAPQYATYWQKKNIDVSPFLQEASGKTTSYPMTPGYNEASTKINDLFNDMFLGHISVQQAVSQ